MRKQFKKALTSTNLIISSIALIVMSGLILFGYNIFIKGTTLNSTVTSMVGSSQVQDTDLTNFEIPLDDSGIDASTGTVLMKKTVSEIKDDTLNTDVDSKGIVVFKVISSNMTDDYVVKTSESTLSGNVNTALSDTKSNVLTPYYIVKKENYNNFSKDYKKTLDIIDTITVSKTDGSDGVEAYLIGLKTINQ